MAERHQRTTPFMAFDPKHSHKEDVEPVRVKSASTKAWKDRKLITDSALFHTSKAVNTEYYAELRKAILLFSEPALPVIVRAWNWEFLDSIKFSRSLAQEEIVEIRKWDIAIPLVLVLVLVLVRSLVLIFLLRLPTLQQHRESTHGHSFQRQTITYNGFLPQHPQHSD